MSYESVSSDNMDILEVGLQNRLNQYSESHPNLVKLWKEYIKVKRISYLRSIVDCESYIIKCFLLYNPRTLINII